MESYGWSPFFSESLRAYPGCRSARVASETRGLYQLWTATGPTTLTLKGAWPQDHPVTGDWVAISDNRIEALLPRRTKVSRKKAGRAVEEQVLAANIDIILLVTGLDHDYNLRRIERYLLLAAESRADPVIVLNKADLCDDPVSRLQEIDRLAPNVPAVLLSAIDPGSVAQLHRYIDPGQTAVLLGSSGVGKSTIVNALLHRQAQPTQPVREGDDRGRHTTTGRQLFLLPQGWLLLDTPGLRELEPWATPESTDAVFADIAEAAANCHYRDCRHNAEPGCAVRDTINPARLASYHKLQRELQAQRRKHHLPAALEEKRKWKAIHKAMRHNPKR
ncbi:MAG: ribosome small subunit-dependent GTPase A [Bryobacterales bacterium]|nr:ribosome small subunit-dependent GTPase A [Bryobacterales bacterium]